MVKEKMFSHQYESTSLHSKASSQKPSMTLLPKRGEDQAVGVSPGGSGEMQIPPSR